MNIIALDWGLKRMGLAQCLQGALVLPLSPIVRKNREQAALDLDNVLSDKKCDILVVGLPQNDEAVRRIKHFVGLLRHSCDICFVSEDLSSKEAISQGARDDKTGKIDSISATIILERFLKKPL